MKLVRVEFTKLFGYFDYSIDFHDTVTILHGLNGCGKTTMLQTINAVFNKDIFIVDLVGEHPHPAAHLSSTSSTAIFLAGSWKRSK